jgi:hypothetical protein
MNNSKKVASIIQIRKLSSEEKTFLRWKERRKIESCIDKNVKKFASPSPREQQRAIRPVLYAHRLTLETLLIMGALIVREVYGVGRKIFISHPLA